MFEKFEKNLFSIFSKFRDKRVQGEIFRLKICLRRFVFEIFAKTPKLLITIFGVRVSSTVRLVLALGLRRFWLGFL